MSPADMPLGDLRQQIDEIDSALHDLVMRRCEVAARIGALKNNGQAGKPDEGAFFRPGREAKVLRRLAERHRGALPKATIVRLWRELMSALLRLQGPFAVAAYAPGHLSGFWDLARDHFGSQTPITPYDSPAQVLRAVMDRQVTVGVLPLPQDDVEPWWRYLLGNEPNPVRIVARLPFGALGTVRGAAVEAFAVGRTPPEETGQDRSLFVLEAGAEMSRSGLRGALEAAGLAPALMHSWHEPSDPNRWQHLVEIDGFVTPDDERLRRLAMRQDEAIRGVRPVGGYAVPFTAAELGGS